MENSISQQAQQFAADVVKVVEENPTDKAMLVSLLIYAYKRGWFDAEVLALGRLIEDLDQ